MRTLRPLTESERSILEKELKLSRDAGDWRRIFVILNYDEGLSVEELAQLSHKIGNFQVFCNNSIFTHLHYQTLKIV